MALRMAALATALDARVGQLTEGKVTQLLALTLTYGTDDPDMRAAVLAFERDRHRDVSAAGSALNTAVLAITAKGVDTIPKATQEMREHAWQRRVDING
ncbi:MAG: hypothetical protein AAF753_11610 [Pseudomonadota bacterium]